MEIAYITDYNQQTAWLGGSFSLVSLWSIRTRAAAEVLNGGWLKISIFKFGDEKLRPADMVCLVLFFMRLEPSRLPPLQDRRLWR